jgi:nucleoside-diphosphate-sugar epimerase
MKVLIMGGNRFVGRRAADRLVQSGAEVFAVHRSLPSLEGLSVIRGDRCDPDVVARALAVDPDMVLDMSLYTGKAAQLLVDALDGRDLRYVGVSTAAIYSQSAPPPWNESTPVCPAPGWGAYGVEKAEADAIILGAGLTDALLVRPPYVLGADDPDRRCSRLFARAEAGGPVFLPGDGASIAQVIDADDMADILVRLLLAEATGVMDIPGPVVRIAEFVQRCVSLAGAECEVRSVVKGSGKYAPERWPFPNLNLWVSGERFRGELAVRQKSLEEILVASFESWAAEKLSLVA